MKKLVEKLKEECSGLFIEANLVHLVEKDGKNMIEDAYKFYFIST